MPTRLTAWLSSLLILSTLLNFVLAWRLSPARAHQNRIWIDDSDRQFDVQFGKPARSLATAATQADFTTGLGRKRLGLPSVCRMLGGRSYFFCAEGEAFARAVAYMQNLSQSADPRQIVTEVGEEQMGLGMALGAVDTSHLHEFLASSPTSRQKKFIIDGWGFGSALAKGTAKALELCESELTPEFRPSCYWGVGRSRWFSGEAEDAEAESSRPTLRAGFAFARRFAGNVRPSGTEEVTERLDQVTIELAELLMTGHSNMKNAESTVHCLYEKHLSDCVAFTNRKSP